MSQYIKNLLKFIYSEDFNHITNLTIYFIIIIFSEKTPNLADITKDMGVLLKNPLDRNIFLRCFFI